MIILKISNMLLGFKDHFRTKLDFVVEVQVVVLSNTKSNNTP